jgi:hypothetical protein
MDWVAFAVGGAAGAAAGAVSSGEGGGVETDGEGETVCDGSLVGEEVVGVGAGSTAEAVQLG